jgi:hypothetical protein
MTDRLNSLVVIDIRSEAGKFAMNGEHSGTVQAGELQHPYIACEELSFDTPGWIRGRRGGADVVEYIPAGVVVGIAEIKVGTTTLPFGFAKR